MTTVSAKNSIKDMNRYSPNKFVLRKANLPNVCGDQLTALENNISSRAVAEIKCTAPCQEKFLQKVNHLLNENIKLAPLVTYYI